MRVNEIDPFVRISNFHKNGKYRMKSSDAAELDDKEYVMGLEKGLSIVEAFGLQKSPMTLTQIAEITGHSKASVRRCLLTLSRLGYARLDGRLFTLEPRSLRLGHAYLSSIQLTRVAQPILELVSERVQESASLAVLDSQDIVFVARAVLRESLAFGLSVGSRLPAYCSGTGRILLSDKPKEEVHFMLNRMSRPALAPKTQTQVPKIMREIEIARTKGYALIDEELQVGNRSIAVPIRTGQGKLVAAMSLSVASSRMSLKDMVDKLLPELEAGRRAFASLI